MCKAFRRNISNAQNATNENSAWKLTNKKRMKMMEKRVKETYRLKMKNKERV